MNNFLTKIKQIALFIGLLLISYAGLQAEEPRIVSIGGSITEIVYALGAGKALVGVDSSSVYPALATKLPQIGYQRTLSAEGVLSLRPTLILVSDKAGPPRVIEQLKETGIPLEIIHYEYSVEGTKTKIRTVARILERQPQGEVLVRHLEETVAKIRAVQTFNGRKKRVLFIFAHEGSGAVLAAGRDTPADAIISLAGATNPITEYKGYKSLTTESLLKAMPDTILVGSEGVENTGKIADFLNQPGFAATPAGRSHHIVTMDMLLLLGFGPRLGEALQQLTTLL
jgi:iron complex transport system substrate-binding protein